MSRKSLSIFCLLLATTINAQVKFAYADIQNLVAMSQFYSGNMVAKNDHFAKSIDSLRTPLLNKLADAMILSNKGTPALFTSTFMQRPERFEMLLWYVVREIHYNRISKTKKPRPDMDVAKETLTKQIDERWLLDNYYYRINGGLGNLITNTDLSATNIDIDSYGLKDSTERTIFFVNLLEALVAARFQTLIQIKNPQRIVSYCNRLPTFNNNYYYYFKSFNMADFEIMGYEKMEFYYDRHIDKLYDVLLAHYNSLAEEPELQQEIYYNSILNEPGFFQHSKLKANLVEIYEQSR